MRAKLRRGRLILLCSNLTVHLGSDSTPNQIIRNIASASCLLDDNCHFWQSAAYRIATLLSELSQIDVSLANKRVDGVVAQRPSLGRPVLDVYYRVLGTYRYPRPWEHLSRTQRATPWWSALGLTNARESTIDSGTGGWWFGSGANRAAFAYSPSWSANQFCAHSYLVASRVIVMFKCMLHSDSQEGEMHKETITTAH